MKIELLSPFKEKWKTGYLRISNEGRRIVDLFNSNTNRSTISYSRYIYSVSVGFEIPSDLEVDHIDDDFTNDSIENLQLLTPEQNRLKQLYKYITKEQTHYHVQCAYCEFQYLISERDLKMKQAKGLEHIFCSRSCAANFQHGKESPSLMVSYDTH